MSSNCGVPVTQASTAVEHLDDDANAADQRAQGRLPVAHDQRCRHVGDAQQQILGSIRSRRANGIVVVAAAQSGGAIARRELIAVQNRQLRVEEIRLDSN